MESAPLVSRDSAEASSPSRPATGPPEADVLSTGAPSHPQPRRMQRSCNICHRRKVRCDKQQPCSQCKRGGLVCMYPHAEQLRRVRKSKTTIADVATRISDLERTLVSVSHKAVAVPSEHSTFGLRPRSTPRLEVAHSTPSSGHGEGPGVLVQKGSSSQYFNEILLSRVLDEEQGIQTVLSTPGSERSQPASVRRFNPMGIFSSPSYAQPVSSFLPPKTVAVQLWKAFVDKVEPCTKVLHIPTAEVTVYTAIDSPTETTPETLALCFATFFASATTFEEDEARGILDGDPTTTLQQLKTGFEQAIAHADFLENPTVTTIQALAIYLSALRVHNAGRGIWTLAGLVIRAAQSIGLHRDGKLLGLSPFESEIRRRLWWYLVCRDGRAAEDYGLESTRPIIAGPASDIDVPLNVHDSDIYPEMEKLPPARPGWTLMTLSCVGISIALAWQDSAQRVAASGGQPEEWLHSELLRDLKARTESYLSRCNPVIPLQRLTMHIASFIFRKLELVTRQQIQVQAQPDEREAFATEENLAEALEILEAGAAMITDDRLKPWRWSMRLYPQHHMLLYVLWHLCVRPEGANRDRIWDTVEAVFMNTEFMDAGSVGRGGLGSRWEILSALKAKALAIRADRAAARAAGEAEAPVLVVPSGSGAADAAGIAPDPADVDWMDEMQIMPDWTTLMKDFQMDNSFKFGF
ncbi:hypothetical protein ACHAQA_008668 [Verticillium albo-atrum]